MWGRADAGGERERVHPAEGAARESFRGKETARRQAACWGGGAAGAYVLDDHDEEGQLDAECLRRVRRARHKGRRDVGRHDLKHGRLNVVVGDALDVAIAHLLLPNLQRLGACARRGGRHKRKAGSATFALERGSRQHVGGEGGCFAGGGALCGAPVGWRLQRRMHTPIE